LVAEARLRACHDTWRGIRPGEEWVLPRQCWMRRNLQLQAGDDQSRVVQDHEVQTPGAGRRVFRGPAGRGSGCLSRVIRSREIRLAAKRISKEADCARLRSGP